MAHDMGPNKTEYNLHVFLLLLTHFESERININTMIYHYAILRGYMTEPF